MITEITKHRDAREVRGWIFYDAACRVCAGGRQRMGGWLASWGFDCLPLQTPGTAARLGVTESALMTRMHLLRADGRVFSGVDAFGVLCRSVWWLWPIGMLLLVPGLRDVARAAYDWFARNRYCIGGACGAEGNPGVRPTKDHSRHAAFFELP